MLGINGATLLQFRIYWLKGSVVGSRVRWLGGGVHVGWVDGD